MEISNLIPHIESLIFASDKPLTSLEITDLINAAFGFMEEKIVVDQVEASIEGIVEKYNSEFYPFEVKQSGGGWQFLTKKEFHKTVAQLNGEKFLKRLSSAALETLAIVAYKQPVTKGEIESIRGVSSDYAIQKLLEKELVIIPGVGFFIVHTVFGTFLNSMSVNKGFLVFNVVCNNQFSIISYGKNFTLLKICMINHSGLYQLLCQYFSYFRKVFC